MQYEDFVNLGLKRSDVIDVVMQDGSFHKNVVVGSIDGDDRRRPFRVDWKDAGEFMWEWIVIEEVSVITKQADEVITVHFRALEAELTRFLHQRYCSITQAKDDAKDFKDILCKLQDPEYNEYLRLKEKFKE